MENIKKSTMSRYDNKKIAWIISLIASLLCFIGLFGTLMTEHSVERVSGKTYSQLRETFDLAYIFKYGWTSQYFYGNTVSKFALSLLIISFIIGVLGVLFAVGKTIYSAYKKDEINFKFNFAILLVSSVQYAFMSRFALGYDGLAEATTSYNASTTYLMGWGVILITIGFFLGLISIFIYDFDSKESVLNKTSILTRVSSILVFFVGLYGITNMASIGHMNEETKATFTKSFNSFSFISYLNEDGSIPKANIAPAKALAIIAIIFGIISFIGLVASAFFYIKGEDNELEKKITKISTISFAATSLVANIFMYIAEFIATRNETGDIGMLILNPGFTSIISLILGVGLIVLFLLKYKKNKVVEAK